MVKLCVGLARMADSLFIFSIHATLSWFHPVTCFKSTVNKSGPEDIYKVEIVNILFSVQIYKKRRKNVNKKLLTDCGLSVYDVIHACVVQGFTY